ncbi:uncharacterized protein Tco025E_01349 [Trypanosoma conorhini]|uniref:Uncharacterized protein n=1 Tax=Trypanosoma conorhini TaxID=83891 RepID=A0A3R7LKP4_9TRYP|nr:uncharacterized protein Tco025E_01349 [Trypanosoma conorhini]RNF26579.1 hypothetical protein Tco025E_01349 [Trypanosoma conorhini]
MEKAFEGTKSCLREVQAFLHRPSYPIRKSHGSQLKKNYAEKEVTASRAEAENTPNRGSAACTADLSSAPTATLGVDESDTYISREEILIDPPTQDADDDPDTSLGNAKTSDCDGNPTLMELAMWDAEVVKRQLEVARDVECIYESLNVLSACMENAAVSIHHAKALRTATHGTGGESKSEENFVLLEVTQTEAVSTQPSTVKVIAPISDSDDDGWLQLAPSREEKTASGAGGVGAVLNEKLIIDPMDL